MHGTGHMNACLSKHIGVDLTGGGTQTQLSQRSSFYSLGVFNYNPIYIYISICKIINQLPFLFVENESFEEFVNQSFTPRFKKLSGIYKCQKWCSKTVLKRKRESKNYFSKLIWKNRGNFGFNFIFLDEFWPWAGDSW